MNNPTIIFIDKKLYEKESVFATIRSVSPLLQISIVDHDSNNFQLEATSIKSDFLTEEEVKNIVMSDLIDQQIRLDLNKKFGTIRELIVKQAFSPIANTKL